MNLDKLKESARKFEQGGQWRQAIDVYKKALREFEEGGEGVLDPSLYNRIGDLEMKDGDSSAAIRAYEQASDLYTEQGFFNNAIALCSKILRVNPARSATYLRLAQLNARKNFVGEAKRNLGEYLERMDALHHREEGIAAVKLFADQFSGNPDIRLMLVELLRDSSREQDATEQLEKLARELEERGDASGARKTREQIAAIKTDEELPPAETSRRPDPLSGLVFIDTGFGETPAMEASDGPSMVDGLAIERGDSESADEWRQDTAAVDGLELTQIVSAVDDDSMPEVLTEDSMAATGDDLMMVEDDPIDIDAYPTVELEASIGPADDEDGTLSLDDDDGAESADLVYLPVDADADRDSPETIDDIAAYARDRARVLFEIGDRAGGIAALEEALRQFEATSRLPEAVRVADDLIRLEPDTVFRYQKRVELAYRVGDRGAMLEAYLGLADALLRGGGVEHAITVYRRVIDHDPGNERARSSLAMLESRRAMSAPPPAAPAPEPEPEPASDFVDLGSLILDEPQARDTRMRVDQQAPIEDEDAAFHDALEQFKRGIEENIDSEDFQAHYDLGIAFKEMGLLDEAIAQFQKALRSPEGRLKTSEQLGIAFFDKSRFAIAEAVLRRAIESLAGADDEKIGSIYWLGRALEAQRRYDEALRYYERALAVDIRFLDVGDRVHRLTTGAS